MKKNFLIMGITAVAVGLSCWLTIRLCWQLDAENAEATALGFVNDGAKLAFGVLAFTAMGKKRLGLAALSGACALISMLASMGFFMEANHGMEAAAVESTAEWSQLNGQLAAFERLNADDLRVAARYDGLNRITDAKNLRAEIASRETQRNAIANRLDELALNPPAETASPMFAGLSAVLGQPPKTIKLVAFSYLSILLELIGVVGVALCFRRREADGLRPSYARISKRDASAPPLKLAPKIHIGAAPRILSHGAGKIAALGNQRAQHPRVNANQNH